MGYMPPDRGSPLDNMGCFTIIIMYILALLLIYGAGYLVIKFYHIVGIIPIIIIIIIFLFLKETYKKYKK